MDFKDYYSTLGITKSASDKDIKQAFRKLARKYHPDVNPGDKAAEARFKEINEAHEVLSDADTRRKYDELGANWRAYEQAQAHGGQPFGGRGAGGAGSTGGYRTMSPEEVEAMFGGESPFSDFFTTFFGAEAAHARGGRAAGRGRPRPRTGRDVEQAIELTLEDAYHGTTRRLSLSDGNRTRTVDVRIPAGVGEGARVRVPGEGEQGAGGGDSGHLFLRVHLAPHPVFERQGRDLYIRVPLQITTAVLGGAIEVPTLAGKAVRLKVPPLTQNGQLFRLKGFGMPAVGKPEDKGDAYARIEILIPTAITEAERSHYEALASLRGDASSTSAA